MNQESQEWYEEILSAAAHEYKLWIETNDIKFSSWEELGELLKNGLDEAKIWTLEDLWDDYIFNLSNGTETSYRGSGYLPYFEGYPDNDETQYAISSKATTAGDGSVFNEVLITCNSCVDEDGDADPDSDCEFCQGEIEVRFELQQDGNYCRA
jgi:hypothetical protein